MHIKMNTNILYMSYSIQISWFAIHGQGYCRFECKVAKRNSPMA